MIFGLLTSIPCFAAEGDLTQDQLAATQAQVDALDGRKAAWTFQAELLCSQLKEPGQCGMAGANWSACLNEEIRQADLLLPQLDQQLAEAKAQETPAQEVIQKLNDDIQKVKAARDESDTYLKACPALQELARQPYPGSTFLDRIKRSGIASIGFVTSPSWGELEVAGGGAAAAYGAYRTIDKTAPGYFKANPPSKFLTAPGDNYPYVMIPLYGITWIKKWFPDHKPGECPEKIGCFSDRFKLMMDTAVGTLATSEALTEGIKYAVGRERPNGTDKFSFWSGHSIFAANLSGACHATMDNWKFCLLFDAGTLLTMNARVEGRWHYPSDTIAGATAGFIISYWGGKKLKNGKAAKVFSYVDGEHTTRGGTTFTTSTSAIVNHDTKGAFYRVSW
jgi:hypothetical protein